MQPFEGTDPKETLTPDELREFEGLSHLSNEEAQKIIESLYKLALVGIEIIKQK